MALSREVIERCHDLFGNNSNAPWKRESCSKAYVYLKKCMHKLERQRWSLDVECAPEYKRKKGVLVVMGTMPYIQIQIDIISELNDILSDEFRVYVIQDQQPEKDYSNVIGLVLLSLFLHGAYLWTCGY